MSAPRDPPTSLSSALPQSLTPAMRWILGGFIAINLGALPLWLVYLSQVMWPAADLGAVGAIQTAAVVAALLAWRTTEGDLGRRAMVGTLLVFAGSVALLGIGKAADSSGDHATVLVVTVAMTFGMMYTSLALLEMAHRLVRERDGVVRIFTLIDVVDSSSLQVGLFVGGLLVSGSVRATMWTPYVAFVTAMSCLAMATVGRAMRLTREAFVSDGDL